MFQTRFLYAKFGSCKNVCCPSEPFFYIYLVLKYIVENVFIPFQTYPFSTGYMNMSCILVFNFKKIKSWAFSCRREGMFIFHMTYDKLEVHSIIVLFLFKQEYWGFKFIPSPFELRVSCTVSGPSIIMSTSYLRKHWLIPVLQNFRQRFFGLSVSDHGIVWFDIWSKCKLYCVPSLRSIIAGWDILFSVFCFSIYFLKAWFLVEKVGFLVIIFSARKWRERRILHHLPQSFWGPLKAPRPPAVRSQMTLSQICVHIILG